MTIYVWPDASWVYAQDFCDYQDSWRGDDYAILEVDDQLEEDQIDQILYEDLRWSVNVNEDLSTLLKGREQFTTNSTKT